MLTLYFIRHGETVWNTKEIFQGRLNSNLTKKGIEQTYLLADSLKNINFDKIYSSPQGRAVHTAEIIKGDRDLQIEIIEDFQEISLGEVEGISKESFKSKYPQEYNDFWNAPNHYNPKKYNGENYYELLERVKVGLNKLKNEKNKNILIVTHGITLKAIFNCINNLSIENFANQPVPENTSVTTVTLKNNIFSIIKFSDTSHLI